MADDRFHSIFLDWLDRHGAVISKVARAYTKTAVDRQDLAQDILLQLWRSVPHLEGRSAAATWIYRVALNTAMRWSRKENRRQARQRRFMDAEIPDRNQDAARLEAIERLYGAIGRLQAPDVALVLLDLDDLSYREMADVMGISEGNIGVRLNREKKALAALLQEKNHGR